MRQKETLLERVFNSTTETISKLKQEANKDGPKSRFTSYEVICAHWWRRITRARELEDTTPAKFGVLANMRSRLSPELSPGYFGNAVMIMSTFTTAGEILGESLGATAARIHGAVARCNEETMRGTIHWLELNGNTLGSRRQARAAAVRAASSPRFAVYEVDFGWGKAEAMRVAKVMGDGEMVLFPGRRAEG